MNSFLSVTTTLDYLPLYEVVKLRCVHPKLKKYIDTDPTYWREAYNRFLFRPPKVIKEIGFQEFQRDYLEMYDEGWSKRLNKFIVKRIHDTLKPIDYMSIHSEMYGFACSGDEEITQKVVNLLVRLFELLKNREGAKKSVEVACKTFVKYYKIKIESMGGTSPLV